MSLHSEGKRVEELRGENPFWLGKGPKGEQRGLPLPHCFLFSRSFSGPANFCVSQRPSAAPDLPDFSWRDEAGPAQMHTPPLSSFFLSFLSPGDSGQAREGPPGIGSR